MSKQQYFRVPEWAKDIFGAERAREMSRKFLADFKAKGFDFASAEKFTLLSLAEVAEEMDCERRMAEEQEAAEMREIERTAYYGKGENPYR